MNSKESETRNWFRLSRSNSNTSVSSSISASLSEKNTVHPLPKVNENDRIIYNQGLIRPKQRPTSSNRRIRDRSYYKGLIHLKNVEISNEIKKLQREISLLNIERSTYLPYKKKAESKATELLNLQKTLANYNIAYDIINRDIQLNEVKDEMEHLKSENAKVNDEVEKMFDQTKKREEVIHELETDLSQENYVSEILTATMNSQWREKYKTLKRVDDKLQSERMKQEEEMKKLNEVRTNLENKCSGSKYLREALIFIKKLRELENQKDELFSEKAFASDAEENEHLHKYKNECNDLLRGMAQENRNLEIQVKEIMDKLKSTKTEIPEFCSERLEKYSKLKKNEKIIDVFLQSFGDKQLALLAEQQHLRNKIIKLLKEISNKLTYFNPGMDSVKGSTDNKNDKNVNELESLYLKLTTDLEEINNIEKQVREELMMLKDELAQKEKIMPKISRTEDVKEKLKKRERELQTKLKEIKDQKQSWKFILEDLRQRHDSMEEELKKNETYIILSNLEKRWHSLEEENFSIKTFLAHEKSQKNYSFVKDEVKKIYSELNKML